MGTGVQPELDSLTNLEERIRRAVQLVNELRAEKAELIRQMEQAVAERDQAVNDAADARVQYGKLSSELEELRGERRQVRERIEKLLGQMDVLSAS